MKRPGDRLRAFVSDWCCEDTMTRFIDPAIADLQQEYALASKRSQWLRAVWILACSYTGIVRVMLSCVGNGAVGKGSTWTTEDRKAMRRILIWSVVPTVAVIVLLELPVRSRQFSTNPLLLIYLLPQALPFAFSGGIVIGIVAGLGRQAFSRRVSSAVLAAALVLSCAAFANFGWITPAANQAFRVKLARDVHGLKTHLAPGYSELPLGELRQKLARARADQPILMPPSSFRFLAFYYYSRWALSFTPLLFAVFGLLVVRTRAASRWVLGIFATVAFLGYYMLLDIERLGRIDGPLPPGAGAWYPNVALIVICTLLMLSRLRRNAHDVPAR
jgi:lipopolysaccharide export LptBFGC system permease protein LptF